MKRKKVIPIRNIQNYNLKKNEAKKKSVIKNKLLLSPYLYFIFKNNKYIANKL